MVVGLTVNVGWPWWAITTIASGVLAVCVIALFVMSRPEVHAVAAVLGAEALVIAILAPFVMPDSSGARMMSTMAAAEHDRVIHVIEHAPAPDMQMQGNLQMFANPIFDGKNVMKVGHDQGLCVHIRIAKTWECVWSTFLPGGQITTQGTATGVNAITGGSGTYANAHGWVFVKAHNKAGTQFDEFFHVSG